MIFDDTCKGGKGGIGLSHSWIAGGILFASLNRLHGYKGVRSWEEALNWLNTYLPDEKIDEIQFWGHGRWGEMLIDSESFNISYLEPGHFLSDHLDTLKSRLHKDSLLWIRTCQSFGANSGHRFAEALTDRFQCRVAGHTFIIGPWQSGLHILKQGEKAHWPNWEGIREGTPENPTRALWSKVTSTRTVSFLNITIPRRLKKSE